MSIRGVRPGRGDSRGWPTCGVSAGYACLGQHEVWRPLEVEGVSCYAQRNRRVC